MTSAPSFHSTDILKFKTLVTEYWLYFIQVFTKTEALLHGTGVPTNT